MDALWIGLVVVLAWLTFRLIAACDRKSGES